MRGKTAVVTGACGFIGSHLAEELVRRGAHVKALALYDARGARGWLDQIDPALACEMEIISGDIRDAEQMRRLIRKDDVVFHLAALIGIPYSYIAPRSYVQTNIEGTLNVLEAAREAGAARVMNMSTSEVYGSALRVPIDEDHPLQGQSPYSASKIGAEKMTESYVKSFALPAVTVRAFNTFGPRQSPRAVIPTILMQLLAGEKELHLGNLHSTRDFNFVADTVEGLIRLAACEAAIGRAVNIGTGAEITIAQLAENAQRAVGHTASIIEKQDRMRPEHSEVQRLCADASLLHSLTGWTPPPRLEEGLRLTADWMKTELTRYEPQRYYV
ncbi:MAG: SDR family NAD(P)-dependent oxidoreductase [Kiritimatiellae bacterium]|nr:SDR family NAD(P)-dependent oxidoreductase [Kiritimatiellia bacterium]MDD4735540.1 SDR family NAD(P)-dependent oxidoreductase [Kiritimatiellia bacterium]